jgi:hypothetical protein
MKIFKSRILLINSILMLLAVLFFQNCEEEKEEFCTGCTSGQPYSKPGQTTCYATLADCEAALGSGCIICN